MNTQNIWSYALRWNNSYCFLVELGLELVCFCREDDVKMLSLLNLSDLKTHLRCNVRFAEVTQWVSRQNCCIQTFVFSIKCVNVNIYLCNIIKTIPVPKVQSVSKLNTKAISIYEVIMSVRYSGTACALQLSLAAEVFQIFK